MLLRDRLNYYQTYPVSTGGTWTLVDYNNAPNPITLTIGGTPTVVTPGYAFTGDNPSVTWTSIPHIVFRYSVSCSGHTSASDLTVDSVSSQPADNCGGLPINYPDLGETSKIKNHT